MIKKIISRINSSNKINEKSYTSTNTKHDEIENLSKDLNSNIKQLQKIFGISNDVIIRKFNIGFHDESNAAVIFIDGLVEKKIINENIMKSLMLDSRMIQSTPLSKSEDLFHVIKMDALSAAELNEVEIFQDVINGVLSGDTILLIDGYNVALNISTKGWESRDVGEPHTEAVVRGPREGFTESLRTNTALLRRKIKSPDLVFETMRIGRVTRTDVCIAYIRTIADDKIIEELRRRLNRVDIDGIMESGYIEEFIEDKSFSIFSTVGNTEKPDVTAAKLLEGRVAVFTDGTPVVLTLPYLFVESLQASEDYYSRPWYSTMIRWVRIGALIVTMFLPALYIAAQSFHHEMIPTVLLITMAAAKEGIPFPVFLETLLLGISFEILREAGIRMPRPVGQAVSIVGALILGEAAVSAGIVSAPAVIVIGLTGISGFLIPSQSDAITITRFLFMILAGLAGLFGIMLGMVAFLIHLAGLRSFGVPYLTPIAPSTIRDMKDVIIRAPMWMMHNRPHGIGDKNHRRMKDGSMPSQTIDKEKKLSDDNDKGRD